MGGGVGGVGFEQIPVPQTPIPVDPQVNKTSFMIGGFSFAL